MKWSEKLKLWKNHDSLPNDYGYYFQTSCCNKKKDKDYDETWTLTGGFKKQQDFSKFENYIKKAKEKGELYATHFPNPSGTNILVIPMPKKNKNYAHLRLFCDNAPKKQKVEFWKYVAKQVDKALKKSETVFVSTHGKDVPYLHVRIECFPKNHLVYKKQYLEREGCKEYQSKKCNLK